MPKVKKIGGTARQEKLDVGDVMTEAGKICDKILDVSVRINPLVAEREELEQELSKELLKQGKKVFMHDGIKFKLAETPSKIKLQYSIPKA